MDVFLSYSYSDQDFARRLTHDLEQKGISVVSDLTEAVEPGSNYLAVLIDTISNTPVFVPLISRSSIKSAWVSSEIAAALTANESSKHHSIIPIVIESDVELPTFLKAFSAIDGSNAKSYETCINALKEAVRTTIKSHNSDGPLEENDRAKIINEVTKKVLYLADLEQNKNSSVRALFARSRMIDRWFAFSGISLSVVYLLVSALPWIPTLHFSHFIGLFIGYASGALSTIAAIFSTRGIQFFFLRGRKETSNE